VVYCARCGPWQRSSWNEFPTDDGMSPLEQ
jgi:hypothetical protein